MRNFFENFLPGKSLFPKRSSVLFHAYGESYVNYGVTHFPLIPEKIRLLLDIYLWQKILVLGRDSSFSFITLSFYLYHFIEYMFYYTLSHIFWNYSEDIKKLYL